MSKKIVQKTIVPKYLPLLLLIVALVLGSILRTYQLGKNPVSLYWDEMAMLVDAKMIASTGTDMHSRPWNQLIFPSYGDYKLPMYIWLSSIIVWAFGVESYSVRVVSALSGILQIFLIYQLAFEVFYQLSKEKSLARFNASICAILLAVAPWSILFSRTGFEGHLAQFLFSLAVFFLLLSMKKPLFVFAASFSAAAAVYTYFSVRYVWPIVVMGYALCVILPSLLQSKIDERVKILRTYCLHFVLSVVLWGVLLVPLFFSPLYTQSQRFRLSADSIMKNEQQIIESNQFREYAQFSKISKVLYHRYWMSGRELLKNYSDHLDFRYLFLQGDKNLRHSTQQIGLFSWILLPFFLLGLYSIYHKNGYLLLFLLIWWLAALLPASVPTDTPHALRSLNALTPIVLIISAGVTHFLVFTIQSRKQSWSILATVLIISFFFHTATFLHDYFHHYPHRSYLEWQDGYSQTVNFVMNTYPDVQQIYMNQSDKRLYLWFLAHKSFTPEIIHQAKSRQFSFYEVGKLKIDPFSWGIQKPVGEKFIVISDPGMQQWDPIQKTTIYNTAQQPLFEVAEYVK